MTLSKTEAGLRMLKDRHSGLSPRQRAALILFDGQRSLEEVLAATSPGGVTRDDLERLVALGLVAEPPPGEPPFPDSGLGALERERYHQAYGIATQLTAELGGKWGNLNLAVEAAASLEELEALAPRIRTAVGPLKFARLDAVLKPR
ncbi:MAG: hypothetical protein KGL68_07875 [Burkholderiales bacterium]|nr:hypothetical protein [Burkholderiales bacterium]